FPPAGRGSACPLGPVWRAGHLPAPPGPPARPGPAPPPENQPRLWGPAQPPGVHRVPGRDPNPVCPVIADSGLRIPRTIRNPQSHNPSPWHYWQRVLSPKRQSPDIGSIRTPNPIDDKDINGLEVLKNGDRTFTITGPVPVF